MDISKLTDRALLIVFDRLPAQNLFRIHRICARWRSLQGTACERRQSLALLAGDTPANRISRSHLLKSDEQVSEILHDAVHIRMDAELCRVITSASPNVTRLTVVLSKLPIADMVHVSNLLSHWSARLKSLKLFVLFSPVPILNYNMFDLIRVINHLPSLKHLLLEYEGSFYHKITPETRELGYFSVLAQLEQFHFFSYDDASILVSALKHYTMQQAPRVIQVGNPVRSNVVGFLWSCPVIAELTSLWIGMGKFSLRQLSNFMLEKLPKLAHLKLEIDFHSRDTFDSENDQPSSAFAQLSSIEELTLFLSVTSHADLWSHHIGHIFPNLQQMQVFVTNKSNCRICASVNWTSTMKTSSLDNNCQMKLCNGWKEMCPKLSHVSLVKSKRNASETGATLPNRKQMIEQRQCFSCGKIGHIRDSCPEPYFEARYTSSQARNYNLNRF